MKFSKHFACIILVIIMLFSAAAVLTSCFGSFGREEDSSTEPPEVDAEAMSPIQTVTHTSFFEQVFFGIDPEDEEYINEYYSRFPRGMNNTGFLSRGTAVYNDVNGSRVLADAYYAEENEAYGDADVGMALMLYGAISYKIANPREEVSVSFICREMSLSTAVCVIPQSRYFGYMRSLEGNGKDYDENGFVRIAFMLVEAAKMGIDVTVVVQQEDSDDATARIARASFSAYFNNALSQSCYAKYAEGLRVVDYLSFHDVEWDGGDGGVSLNLTALTVSACLDRYGELYENAVFFKEDGVQGVDRLGLNGAATSAVALFGHEEIYNATVNFTRLVAEHSAKDKLDAFKEAINARNAAQAALIADGREWQIPQNDQILWLGNDKDRVFKLCFSHSGYGSADTVIGDMIATELDALAASAESEPDEYRIFAMGGLVRSDSSLLFAKLNESLNKAFVEQKNGKNRVEIGSDGFDGSDLSSLAAGEIGYLSLKDRDDLPGGMLLSFTSEGERRFVSLISAGCSEGELGHTLTLNEGADTGDSFYTFMGINSTDGCIAEEGKRFSTEAISYQSMNMGTLPQTLEAVFEVNESAIENNNYYGMLFSNYDNWNSQVSYEITKNGVPRVTVWITEFVPDETREKGDHYKMTKLYFKFNKVDVRDYSDVHLTIVHDRENEEMRCYVNGELKQTLKQKDVMSKAQKEAGVPPLYDFETVPHFVVGGSWTGSNGQYFRGLLKSMTLWADVRDADEIAIDAEGELDLSDEALLAAYDFRAGGKDSLKDLSANRNDLIEDILWQDLDELAPVEDFAYSFALIGDIQVLSERYFNDHYLSDKGKESDPYDDKYADEDTDPRDNEIEYIQSIINWLVDNKEEHKIEYVMALGDLTQQSYTAEWDYVKSQFYRLAGVVPFSLVPGNHDRRDPDAKDKNQFGVDIWPEELRKNAYFHEVFGDSTYRAEIDGSMYDWDMSNTYNAFEVGDVKYLLINLDYGASDEMLEWASGIVEQYPDRRVIVVTHAYLYRDGTTVDAYDTYPATRIDGGSNDGDEIWEKFISKHENIELVISGHDPFDHIVRAEAVGDNGNVVNQLLVDPQGMDAYMPHGTGMIAMLYFSEDGNTVTVRYYSAVNNRYGSVKSQFTFTLGK